MNRRTMKFHVVECRKFMVFLTSKMGFFYNFILRCFFSNEHIGVQVNWFFENDDTLWKYAIIRVMKVAIIYWLMGMEKKRIPLNLTRYNSGQNCYGNHKECEIATLCKAVGRSKNRGGAVCVFVCYLPIF